MSDDPDFGTFGRYKEVSVAAMAPDMKQAYAFTRTLRGQVPGPHKIWLANPTLSKTVVPIGAYYQQHSTLTKAEIEIATNLINGRWLAAYSNYEHEMIAEEAGGLAPDKVEALIAGRPTAFDDPRQQVVYELASALVAPRVVPKGLYRRAKALLGDAGIVDVTMLLGWFTGVSMTLMAFDVPSNAVGLDQADPDRDGLAVRPPITETPGMTDPSHRLGGRLPLLAPGDLTSAQRTVYDRISATMVPWAEAAGFQSRTADGRLIGPFNPILSSPDITPAFLAWQAAEAKHTTLDARVREVVILAVGAVWRADYELYAHAAVARQAGLPEQAVSLLASGGVSPDLSAKEALAQRYVTRLSTDHTVDDETFREARDAFGVQGLVDMAFLMGAYHTVCALLTGFAIPAPPSSQLSPDGTTASPGMTMAGRPKSPVALSIVASFLPHFFLENLVVRSDNSILVTVATRNELWYLPPPRADAQVDPMLLHRFDEIVTCIVEHEPDVFSICTGNFYTTHEAYLHRLDLRAWAPGMAAKPERVLTFPAEARGLNGGCLLAPNTLLIADSFAGLIWRVDIGPDGQVSPRVWLRHDSMAHVEDDLPPPPQPGINGLRYGSATRHLYYTTMGQKLFMRVRVDPRTLDPDGLPECVDTGTMADDFCLDEEAGVAYVTTHRENTVDRVPLEPGAGARQAVAGHPPDERLLGPSSAAWSRAPGEHRRVLYVTTDGGHTAPPPDNIVRSAKVVRLSFPG